MTTTIFIRRSSKRSTLTIESRNRSETIIPTPLVVFGPPQRTALKPRPMSLDLQQDHLVSCTAQKSIRRRSRASANSYERPVNVPTFKVATRVFHTLRSFRTSLVAPRCRPCTGDPRILFTLTGPCECASAPADAVALHRNSLSDINIFDVTGVFVGRPVTGPVACIRMSVVSSAHRVGSFQWHPLEERTSPPAKYT